tara:strand:- start:175 stop:489 length:315 start_codon:yes stop_codon:yes gene_type:complete
MELQIKCIENLKKPPNYSTTFQYEEYKILLDYNYDKDECFVKVNNKKIEEIGFGEQRKTIYEDGSILENETLKNLIDGLSNSMVGLAWEDCEIGEELTVNPDYL